jgi:hypothetical protein
MIPLVSASRFRLVLFAGLRHQNWDDETRPSRWSFVRDRRQDRPRRTATFVEAQAERDAEIIAQLKALRECAAIQTDRSVTGFCRRWSVSRFLFYQLRKIGKAPAVMHVGGRTLISPESERAWILAREAEATTAPKRIVGKARRTQPAPEAAEAGRWSPDQTGPSKKVQA